MPLVWFSRTGPEVFHICMDCKDSDDIRDTRLVFMSDRDTGSLSSRFEPCDSVKCESHAMGRSREHRRCRAFTSEDV